MVLLPGTEQTARVIELERENEKLRTMLWLLVDDAMTLGVLLPMTLKRARELVDYK